MEDIVGKKFKSNNGGWFTVLKKTDKKQYTACLYEIEFNEINKIKYRTLATKSNISRGTVKNPYYPATCGVGYLGNAKQTANKKMYNRWISMLKRCYNQKHNGYKTYGARGVTVCERWHSFENFLHDFKLLEGYDENNIDDLHLDKDIKFSGNKVYSLETCMLVKAEENTAEKIERVNKKFIAISPDGEIYKSNNQRKFAARHGLSTSGVNPVLKGKQKHHKGWKFEYVS